MCRGADAEVFQEADGKGQGVCVSMLGTGFCGVAGDADCLAHPKLD